MAIWSFKTEIPPFFIFSSNPMQLFNYVRQCLQMEMRLVQNTNGDNADFSHMVGSTASAAILQKLEMLRRRTQVS